MEFANDNNVLLSVRLALNPPIPPQGWTGDCGFYFTDREEDHQIVDRAVDYVLRKKDACSLSEQALIFSSRPNNAHHVCIKFQIE